MKKIQKIAGVLVSAALVGSFFMTSSHSSIVSENVNALTQSHQEKRTREAWLVGGEQSWYGKAVSNGQCVKRSDLFATDNELECWYWVTVDNAN